MSRNKMLASVKINLSNTSYQMDGVLSVHKVNSKRTKPAMNAQMEEPITTQNKNVYVIKLTTSSGTNKLALNVIILNFGIFLIWLALIVQINKSMKSQIGSVLIARGKILISMVSIVQSVLILNITISQPIHVILVQLGITIIKPKWNVYVLRIIPIRPHKDAYNVTCLTISIWKQKLVYLALKTNSSIWNKVNAFIALLKSQLWKGLHAANAQIINILILQ